MRGVRRLRERQALINRMGFNNDGLETIRQRLEALGKPAGVLGANIGANKDSADLAVDYVCGLRALYPLVDYVTVNVSSPNTPGLRDLQAVEKLEPLLLHVRETADREEPDRRVPLLVKIAPDLADEDVLAVADLATRTIARRSTLADGYTTLNAGTRAVGAGGSGLSSHPPCPREGCPGRGVEGRPRRDHDARRFRRVPHRRVGALQ